MSADFMLVKSPPQSFRWWFLPSWLGLDAPSVVLTWTWAVSRATDTPLPLRPAAAMFLVVWSIYLADRLFDVGRVQDWCQATGRLRFGRDWQPLFWACLGCCSAGIFALLWLGLPADVLLRAGVVALGVGLHFLVFVLPMETPRVSEGAPHATSPSKFPRLRVGLLSRKLPGKELGVGLFFALGAYACLGGTLPMLPLFASIALVVAYNCLVIAARDAESDRELDPGGASQWWKTMDRDLLRIGFGLTLTAIVAGTLLGERAFYLAVTVAFAALSVLHRHARQVSGDEVRALADFALFTPVPLFCIVDWWLL